MSTEGRVSLQVHLARRPVGAVRESDFRLVHATPAVLKDGEVLVRNTYLSLDPYMRERMTGVRSYARPQAVGETMMGATAGEIVESRNSRFAPGAAVTGYLGWQSLAVSNGSDLQRVDTEKLPLSAYLGVAGMPGVTAWIGLREIARPRAGETVVVSAASGAVGGVVIQLALQEGCRVVAIAGDAEKCRYCREELGAEICIDRRSPEFADALKRALPEGADVYFDNVGGECLNLMIRLLRAHGRIALCGMMSQYERAPEALSEPMHLLLKRIRLEGFVVSDHLPRWPAIQVQLGQLAATGQLKYRETITQGLENAPHAFVSLMAGDKIGKQLIQIT